jgi:hypothetical protein
MKRALAQSTLRGVAREAIHEAWLAAREEALAAYDAWCSAERGAKPESYAVYRAAADREDAAMAPLLEAVHTPDGGLAAAA